MLDGFRSARNGKFRLGHLRSTISVNDEIAGLNRNLVRGDGVRPRARTLRENDDLQSVVRESPLATNHVDATNAPCYAVHPVGHRSKHAAESPIALQCWTDLLHTIVTADHPLSFPSPAHDSQRSTVRAQFTPSWINSRVMFTQYHFVAPVTGP